METMDTFCVGLDEFDTNIRKIWQNLQKEEEFCDMTLACEGKVIKTHKVIISAISPILRNILRNNSITNPCIYLRGVKFKELENLLNFVYQGEVCIEEEDINSFLEVGKELQIKGMAAVQKLDSKSSPMDPLENRENIETVKIVFSDETAENIMKIETEDTIIEPHTRCGQKRVSTVEGPSGIKYNINPVKKVKSEITSNIVLKENSEKSINTAETEFRCEICNKVYTKLGALNIHKASVHEGITYPCERCGKAYSQAVNLKRHIMSVHENSQFPCELCGKTYNDISAVRLHIKTKHEGVRHQCELCGKDFRAKCELKKHKEVVHYKETFQ